MRSVAQLRRLARDRRGVALLELAVALFVLSVAVLGALAATAAAAGGLEQTRRLGAAALAAQGELEYQTGRPYADLAAAACAAAPCPPQPCARPVPAGLACALEVVPATGLGPLLRVTVRVSYGSDPYEAVRMVGLAGPGLR